MLEQCPMLRLQFISGASIKKLAGCLLFAPSHFSKSNTATWSRHDSYK